jgi:DedD protein
MPISAKSGTDSALAVDELKRRARRRLVGAVVLALAAAVILPLLLESDPKPLGDDVSIKIPPVDSGRFVNPLSPDKAAGAPAASDAKSGPSTPRKSIADAERRVLGQPAASAPSVPAAPGAAPASAPPTAAAPVPAPVESPANIDPPAKVDPPAKIDPATKIDPPVKSDAPAKPEAPAKADASTKAESPATPSGPVGMRAPPSTYVNEKAGATAATAPVDAAAAYSVQVGAFVDAKSAADLADTLKRGGFPAYTEGVATKQGTVQRVRVGPFATRAAADAGLAKLKSAGYGSAVVKTPQ